MDFAPIFLVGIGRSGTTLLRLMFHNHPNIAVPYESHFITNYFRELEKYGDLSLESNLDALIDDILREELLLQWDHEFSKDRIKNKISSPELSEIFGAVFQDYADGKNKKRWADKSDYLNRMHIMASIFPNAKFIHIIRDGRDVANSVLKLPWGPRDLIGVAEWWNNDIRMARAVGVVLGKERYCEVQYEQLVEHSERELIRLCEFVGETYSEQMLNYYKTSDVAIPDSRKQQHHNSGEPPKKSRTFAWKKEMSDIDVAVFNDYAKDSLSDLGYEVPERSCSDLSVKLAKVKIFAKRVLAN